MSGAKLTFRGAAKPSTSPKFLDHCVGMLNEAWWREGAPTANFVPDGLSIRATFAWRGETFASGFPGTDTEILLGHAGSKQDKAESVRCTGSYAQAIQKLAMLLDHYLERQTEARAQWTEQARKDRQGLALLINETTTKS